MCICAQTDGSTPLGVAIPYRKVEMMKVLIGAGAAVNGAEVRRCRLGSYGWSFQSPPVKDIVS
jgi:hypothetical protein